MNYVESFDLFGVEAKQIPCIRAAGAPTTATEGAVGCFYMNTDNGATYKCTAVSNGSYTWVATDIPAVLYTEQTLSEEQKAQVRNNIGAAAPGEGGGSADDAVLYTEQTLTEDQKVQARDNIGAASDDHLKNLKDGLNSVTSVVAGWVPVECEIIPRKAIVNNGNVLDTEADGFYVSNPVAVVPGESLLVTASKNYANNLYAFYDAEGKVVSKNAGGSGEVTVTDMEVTVPNTASTLVVATCYSNPLEIKRLAESGAMKLQPWKGRIWTVVGDSLTEKNSRTDLNYHDYIADATGITVVNLGYSGSGYAKSGAGAAFHSRITNVSPSSDVVTIFGSFNDLSSGLELGTAKDSGTTTICGCINTTIDNLIAVMPTVSLGIVTPTAWESGDPSNPNNQQTKYADALVEICKNRSIPCLDLYRCSNLRPWTEEGRIACYSKDDGAGCHPDETGHKLIAARFKAFLESLIM